MFKRADTYRMLHRFKFQCSSAHEVLALLQGALIKYTSHKFNSTMLVVRSVNHPVPLPLTTRMHVFTRRQAISPLGIRIAFRISVSNISKSSSQTVIQVAMGIASRTSFLRGICLPVFSNNMVLPALWAILLLLPRRIGRVRAYGTSPAWAVLEYHVAKMPNILSDKKQCTNNAWHPHE